MRVVLSGSAGPLTRTLGLDTVPVPSRGDEGPWSCLRPTCVFQPWPARPPLSVASVHASSLGAVPVKPGGRLSPRALRSVRRLLSRKCCSEAAPEDRAALALPFPPVKLQTFCFVRKTPVSLRFPTVLTINTKIKRQGNSCRFPLKFAKGARVSLELAAVKGSSRRVSASVSLLSEWGISAVVLAGSPGVFRSLLPQAFPSGVQCSTHSLSFCLKAKAGQVTGLL